MNRRAPSAMDRARARLSGVETNAGEDAVQPVEDMLLDGHACQRLAGCRMEGPLARRQAVWVEANDVLSTVADGTEARPAQSLKPGMSFGCGGRDGALPKCAVLVLG